MRERIVAGALAVCLPFVSACFDVEQAMKLQKDMSGEVGFSMTVNMEPMVLFMLKMQREMSNQKGEPTAAEIEKAKKEFLASGKTKTTTSTAQKEQMEKSLPAGVKLLSSSVKEDGLKITAKFNLAFDHVSKLADIQMQGKPDPAAKPGPPNPFDRPFPGLKVTDEGKTLLMTMEATNPAAEQKEQSSQMNMSAGGPEADRGFVQGPARRFPHRDPDGRRRAQCDAEGRPGAALGVRPQDAEQDDQGAARRGHQGSLQEVGY